MGNGGEDEDEAEAFIGENEDIAQELKPDVKVFPFNEEVAVFGFEVFRFGGAGIA
nr:hypothetical protein [Phaeodactylibacter xiamenensis]